LLIAAVLLAGLAARRWVNTAGLALLLTVGMIAPLKERTPTSTVRYTLVQPYIPQSEINDGSKFEAQFTRIARLTAPGHNQSRVVLWPESAIPDYLEDGYPARYYFQLTAGGDPKLARQRIGRTIGPQSTLLTGVVNLNIGKRPDGTSGAVSARNSVMALDGAGLDDPKRTLLKHRRAPRGTRAAQALRRLDEVLDDLQRSLAARGQKTTVAPRHRG
jgi:apolipoprotein N-acyltransferase